MRHVTITDCPALHHRSPGYPFGDQVPARIRMTKTVLPDLPYFSGRTKYPVAHRGAEFRAWTNSQGAVLALFPNGEKLGVKPGEFEVIDWVSIRHEDEVLM